MARISETMSFRDKFSQIHWLLFLGIMALGVLGVCMQYSAAGGAMQPWAAPQLIRFGMGVVLFFIIALMSAGWLMRLAYPIYLLCLGMLVFVEIGGHIGMGAQRWIDLGFMRIQPSEFMKPALILALARYFHMVRSDDMNHFMMLIPPLVLIALPVALILKQPNLGTATIMLAISAMMLFAAGLRWQYFAAVIVAVLLALPIAWQSLHDYQKQRVMTFLDPSQDPLGSGYNITQSIIAIGSGGLTGKGFLNGSQGQLDFLPEKQTDFIFTMLAEEFGFIGVMALMLSFAVLLGYGMALAMRAKSRFGALIAAGVVAMLFAHIFINMAMVMGVVPVVGVPLPFLSYGGTFLLTVFAVCGLLMNVFIHRDVALHRNMKAIL